MKVHTFFRAHLFAIHPLIYLFIFAWTLSYVVCMDGIACIGMKMMVIPMILTVMALTLSCVGSKRDLSVLSTYERIVISRYKKFD